MSAALPMGLPPVPEGVTLRRREEVGRRRGDLGSCRFEDLGGGLGGCHGDAGGTDAESACSSPALLLPSSQPTESGSASGSCGSSDPAGVPIFGGVQVEDEEEPGPTVAEERP